MSSNVQSSQQEEHSVLGYPSRLLGRTGIAKDTAAIRLERPRNFLFKAGQFVDLILLGYPPDRAHALTHTFSIASSPFAEEIVVATRMRDSPFKRALSILPIGTDVRIEGPLGSFTLHNNTATPAVLLAGGIGIAPFLSMLSYAAEERLRHPIVLFYANRHFQDAAFLDPLWKLERANPRFRFAPTFTRMTESDGEWRGEAGHISPEMISKRVGNLRGPIFYIAGPPSMVAAAAAPSLTPLWMKTTSGSGWDRQLQDSDDNRHTTSRCIQGLGRSGCLSFVQSSADPGQKCHR